MNLPNQLTCARLVMTGLFVAVISFDWPFRSTVAMAMFVVASITDWLDGYLARKWNLVTNLGKLLDPLADKILVTAALFYASYYDEAPIWMCMTMVAREFLITGLRTLAASQGIVMAAEKLGKHKTISQMVAIITMLVLQTAEEMAGLADYDLDQFLLYPILSHSLYWLYLWATAITIFSGVSYFIKNRHLVVESAPVGTETPSVVSHAIPPVYVDPCDAKNSTDS